jgi:signal transduction histidine kinase
MPRIRSALGLRGRIAGAVLLSAVVSLAVAAVALLGPLEHSLRTAEVKSLVTSLGKHPARPFRALYLCTIVSDRHGEEKALGRAESKLATQIGGTVVVLGDPGQDGEGATPLPARGEDESADDLSDDTFSDATIAFRTGKSHSSTATVDGKAEARRVIPFTNTCPVPGGQKTKVSFVLAVRKSIAEIPAVANVVRHAFFDAAVAALALTILLGIPLSGRLVRRLRRLREVASMQQRLSQQEQARRSFVATASHELRTPLASLDGMLELLGEDLHDEQPDKSDARALLDRARAQSRRLGRLAADLLDLSRIDAQVQLRSEPVELHELGRAVLAEFELGTAERQIHSSLRGPADTAVWALGDPGSIARILRILLDNAVRASPPESRITVTLAQDDDARICVCDEGPGVRVEERDTIFERFSRGKDTSGQAGFGLGLAIGRELARRMGGDLVLESDGSPGARFSLILPAALAPEGDPVPVA